MRGENADELWDLYTKDREKTGCLHRRGDRMIPGEYRLAVHVCIFNRKNQLLIQQRQPFKKGWPNMWDVSIGGSAAAGDTSSQAAQRELQEELGIEMDLSDARPMFTMNFESGFDDFYVVEQDVDLSALRLQNEEVKDVRWADREEVLRLQKQGLMIPYWFLDRLFDIRDVHGTQGEWRRKITIVRVQPEHYETCRSLVEIVQEDSAQPKEAAGLSWDAVSGSIAQGRAVCALDGHMAAGILLFSESGKEPFAAAVHPEYKDLDVIEQMKQAAAGLMACSMQKPPLTPES